MALLSCHECSNQVSSSAVACPHCGAPVKKPMNYGPKASALTYKWPLIAIFGCTALVIIFAIMYPPESTAPQVSEEVLEMRRIAALENKQINDRADQRRGFHCLSIYDGSHRDFKQAVKSRLENPSSFKHVETRVTPIKNNTHTIYMKYRAENGLGATITETATGNVLSSSCKVQVISFD